MVTCISVSGNHRFMFATYVATELFNTNFRGLSRTSNVHSVTGPQKNWVQIDSTNFEDRLDSYFGYCVTI